MATPTTINKEEEIREFLIKLSQIRTSLTKINETLKSEIIRNWIEDINRLQDILEKKMAIVYIRVVLPTMKTELAFRNFNIDYNTKISEINYELIVDEILKNKEEIIRKLITDINTVLVDLQYMTDVVVSNMK